MKGWRVFDASSASVHQFIVNFDNGWYPELVSGRRVSVILAEPKLSQKDMELVGVA